jgi:hypothetical protein
VILLVGGAILLIDVPAAGNTPEKAGAVVSTVITRATERAEVCPAASVDWAVTVCTPSSRVTGKLHVPELPTWAEPIEGVERLTVTVFRIPAGATAVEQAKV